MFSILGYDEKEVVEIIVEHEKRKNDKMTREEAVNTFHNLMYPEDTYTQTIPNNRYHQNRIWAEKAIATYEALGLIKFDKAPEHIYDTRDLTFSSQTPCAYQAISQLEALGYKITKA